MTDVLRRLLAVTPEPPTTSPDVLLEAFEAMHAARAEILAGLEAGEPAGDPELAEELLRRDEAWLDALTRTQAEVGRQRALAGKLRAYAP